MPPARTTDMLTDLSMDMVVPSAWLCMASQCSHCNWRLDTQASRALIEHGQQGRRGAVVHLDVRPTRVSRCRVTSWLVVGDAGAKPDRGRVSVDNRSATRSCAPAVSTDSCADSRALRFHDRWTILGRLAHAGRKGSLQRRTPSASDTA